ncbi:iron ABC transporter permease [soil metagenome]
MATTIRSRTATPLEGDRLPRRWLPAGVTQYLLWGGAVVFILGPIIPILWASLWSTPLYEAGGSFTLDNYSRLFGDPEWWAAVRNSIEFAVLATVGSVVIGTAMAVLFTRTDLPGRRIYRSVVLAPVALPGLVLVIGWASAWAPSGYATRWLEAHTPIANPVNLYSVPGMAVVAISVAAPVVYFFVRGTLSSLDSALEDAARTVGAGPFTVMRTVTVPMLRPAILNSGMIVFALSLEVLGLPLILGTSTGTKFISSYLYDKWVKTTPADPALVAAGAVLLLVMVTVLLLARNRLTGNLARYTTSTGKPTGTSTLQLGPVRWLLSGLVGLYLLVTLVAPLVGIVLSAFTTILSPYISPWSVLTTEHFHTVLGNDTFTASIRNSVVIATVGAALATLAIVALSAVAHRSAFRYRKTLPHVMLYPRAMPGLVVGMAFFWTFAILDGSGSFRTTLWAMGLAFVVRNVALGYSVFFPALASLGEDLDRAARSSGADWWTSMRTVVFRLLRPAMAVSFVLLFVSILGESDPAVFLVTPKTQVMGLTMLQLSIGGVAGPVAALGVIQIVITVVVLGIGRLIFGVRPHA